MLFWDRFYEELAVRKEKCISSKLRMEKRGNCGSRALRL